MAHTHLQESRASSHPEKLKEASDKVFPEMARKAREAREAGLQLNPKYKGDLNGYYIRNSSCLPHEYIAVFVKGIHIDATIEEILDVVEEGKVFSSSRVLESLPRFPHAASNITFMSTQAASTFMFRSIYDGIWIRGQRIEVLLPNKNMVKEFEHGDEDEQFRVLNIYLPSGLVSEAEMVKWLQGFVTFQPVGGRAKEWNVSQGMTMIVITFTSILGQSRMAKCTFEHEFVLSLWGRYSRHCCIEWGADPCDPANRYSPRWYSNLLPRM
ncbi:uncharacterized protein PAC_12213 [Phialocephala subalpina]|uniref:RRM domain-containing protein n=1 Tax=Phialocephala subalpina TaxID=576137 RepID=A0A1L7XBE4_9HELO|nr:uncharacterized protein PAC_12213 [Phialocephala subalpina]